MHLSRTLYVSVVRACSVSVDSLRLNMAMQRIRGVYLPLVVVETVWQAVFAGFFFSLLIEMCSVLCAAAGSSGPDGRQVLRHAHRQHRAGGPPQVLDHRAVPVEAGGHRSLRYVGCDVAVEGLLFLLMRLCTVLTVHHVCNITAHSVLRLMGGLPAIFLRTHLYDLFTHRAGPCFHRPRVLRHLGPRAVAGPRRRGRQAFRRR
jgi:hypothetical protein